MFQSYKIKKDFKSNITFKEILRLDRGVKSQSVSVLSSGEEVAACKLQGFDAFFTNWCIFCEACKNRTD